MSPGVLQETMEKQLCDPQVLTPDFSKPEVRFKASTGDRLRFIFIQPSVKAKSSLLQMQFNHRLKLIHGRMTVITSSVLVICWTIWMWRCSLNLPTRRRYRSTLPCWRLIAFRSSTVDFLTSGKQKFPRYPSDFPSLTAAILRNITWSICVWNVQVSEWRWAFTEANWWS